MPFQKDIVVSQIWQVLVLQSWGGGAYEQEWWEIIHDGQLLSAANHLESQHLHDEHFGDLLCQQCAFESEQYVLLSHLANIETA